MTDRRQNYESAVTALIKQIKNLNPEKMDCFGELYRLTVDLPDTDPLAWLAGQDISHKMYWRDREGARETAGVGTARVFYTDPDNSFEPIINSLKEYKLQDEHIRFYGGFRFLRHKIGADKDRDWDRYYGAYFMLPRLELSRTGDKTELVCNIFIDLSQPDERSDVLSQINHSLGAPVEIERELPDINSRTDYPDRKGWDTMIDRVSTLFENNELEKIVLARKAVLDCAGPVNPWLILSLLRERSRNCYLFAFQFERDTAFIGATPERLYRREGRSLTTEALAGTRPRAADKEEDARLRDELLNSGKDRREHGFVKDSIIDNLASVSEKITADPEISVRQLDRVQHLYCKIESELKENTCDSALLEALHPTPAVGGLPRGKALPLMREMEPFERGWFAAPIGWTSGEKTEFAVAIRSALIKKNKLMLFAGAGIVEGSDAGAEWKEVDNKLENFVHLLEKT